MYHKLRANYGGNIYELCCSTDYLVKVEFPYLKNRGFTGGDGKTREY